MTLKRDKILDMASHARHLCRPHAAQAVADIIEQVSDLKERPY